MQFDLTEHPHRRYNPLTGEWVLVSPHRTKRPWQGQVESAETEDRLVHDPNCYLCPGNSRANGEKNPDYTSNYVFTDDAPVLLEDTPSGTVEKGGMFKAKSVSGICRVFCYSPYHNLTLPELPVEEIVKLIELWQQEYKTLGAHPNIQYVQIFENKGKIMGALNAHPHGRIWAQSDVPVEPAKEGKHQGDYFQRYQSSLLKDYIELELREKERVIIENEHFVVVVPFWAVWPFETMIISKRHFQNILQMTEYEKTAYAEAMKELTTLYDNLFETSFPYSAGIHQAPTDGMEHKPWHFHHHFYPPLLRSATVKKFMVGYEMLGNPQRDLTPEAAAQRLRALPRKHYKQKG